MIASEEVFPQSFKFHNQINISCTLSLVPDISLKGFSKQYFRDITQVLPKVDHMAPYFL